MSAGESIRVEADFAESRSQSIVCVLPTGERAHGENDRMSVLQEIPLSKAEHDSKSFYSDAEMDLLGI